MIFTQNQISSFTRLSVLILINDKFIDTIHAQSDFQKRDGDHVQTFPKSREFTCLGSA